MLKIPLLCVSQSLQSKVGESLEARSTLFTDGHQMAPTVSNVVQSLRAFGSSLARELICKALEVQKQ